MSKEYNPKEIESKWQQYWQENNIYQVENQSDKSKYYVLDMFPYPSGAGLHVGHPLGYIATDIFSRYKKMQGFNVLHPMGFDSFGLPAEQYAIETGQHPAITTENNIKTFKNQLSKIGFNYDKNTEIQTSSATYYRWTQWIFGQLFNAYFDKKTQKAEDIDTLIDAFEKNGNQNIEAVCDENTPIFSAEEWKNKNEVEKQTILLYYRLAFIAEATVNWCPALGMVLANDEVKDGLSERGGHPVERKKMKQWMMRITAYADRLLDNLENLDWSDAVKEMQRNWIGKSIGCEIEFQICPTGEGWGGAKLTAFTTRIDTIFGVSYLVLAPEHEVISSLTTTEQKNDVEKYVTWAKNRSELERQSEVKNVSGVFTGSYVLNPFNQEKIPIWIADYVLAGYGTGVVMGVPSSDERDFRFAKYFNLPIRLVIEGTENMENPTEKKYGKMINSEFLNGLDTKEAIQKAIQFVENQEIGQSKVNFRLRDAAFSRQRYWGEPMPIYYKNGMPYLVDESDLPLQLPEITEYKPTSDGEPPLARAKNWTYKGYPLETTTMPGWAGSSWYFLRYMDSQSQNTFASKQATDYWNQVDLYVGGTEHAVGHLLYSRFWTNFLADRGFISFQEPFKKMINQGMIQGVSEIIYKEKLLTNIISTPIYDYENINKSILGDNLYNVFISADIIAELDNTFKTSPNVNNQKIEDTCSELHVDISKVENNVLNIQKYLDWRPEYKNKSYFVYKKDGKIVCEFDTNLSKDAIFKTRPQVEKMSKRWYNVVNPDDVIEKYSADTLRLYEMFLGPLEQYKPWSMQGIDGCHKFLKRLWRLFYDNEGNLQISNEEPTPAELKALHKCIKGVREDLDRYSFNTPVSKFMILATELIELKCYKKSILEKFLGVLVPYTPHICEELWQNALGYQSSIYHTEFPTFEEKYLTESEYSYPIQINGKMRGNVTFSLNLSKEEIEKMVVENELVQKYLEGNVPKKVIVVPKKIINVVV